MGRGSQEQNEEPEDGIQARTVQDLNDPDKPKKPKVTFKQKMEGKHMRIYSSSLFIVAAKKKFSGMFKKTKTNSGSDTINNGIVVSNTETVDLRDLAADKPQPRRVERTFAEIEQMNDRDVLWFENMPEGGSFYEYKFAHESSDDVIDLNYREAEVHGKKSIRNADSDMYTAPKPSSTCHDSEHLHSCMATDRQLSERNSFCSDGTHMYIEANVDPIQAASGCTHE